jgi:aspartyl-tRNA(Asn)/glutamyl-tRNA(Gln) amidotransferase subunit C
MKLTPDEVRRVAVLARLRLTPEEETQLTGQLDHILSYMDKLSQLDTARVDPFSHAIEAVNVLREDQVTNGPNSDAVLANAPDRENTFFKVPKIIE